MRESLKGGLNRTFSMIATLLRVGHQRGTKSYNSHGVGGVRDRGTKGETESETLTHEKHGTPELWALSGEALSTLARIGREDFVTRRRLELLRNRFIDCGSACDLIVRKKDMT